MNHHLFFAKRKYKKPSAFARLMRILANYKYFRSKGYGPRLPIRTVSQSAAVCFLLALRSGMRAGELCGLEWRRVHAGYCALPMTKTTPREVPLLPKAVRLINKMRGWDSDLVFGLKSQTLDALFRKYKSRAGLSGFTFHDARHTAATWIVRSRVWDAFELCRAFGWSDPKQALIYFNPTASELALRGAKKRG